MYIPIGGIEQWIQMRGAPDTPILLYLHGGPGGTSVPVSEAWRPWEDHFTVVHWDQRGAGRTFAKNGEAGCGPLTMGRMAEDAIEVAEYLTATLGKPKILEFVRFEGCHHFVVINRPHDILRELLARVIPHL